MTFETWQAIGYVLGAELILITATLGLLILRRIFYQRQEEE